VPFGRGGARPAYSVGGGGGAGGGGRPRPATGRGSLVGTAGVVRRALDPEGMVFLDGALWSARSVAGPLPAGTTVTVRAVDGLTLDVDPVAEVVTTAPEGQATTGRARRA
ncbi:MAG: NfeD family protein, partial [Thermomicrobiales bacterium]